MRKLRLMSASVVLLASLGTASGTAAASRPVVCGTQGALSLDNGLYAVGLGPIKSANLSGAIGCYAGITEAAYYFSGYLEGHCGRAAGWIRDLQGHEWRLETAGTLFLVFDIQGPGAGVGVLHVYPDLFHGPHGWHGNNSCIDGTAHEFLMSGLVAHS